MLVRPHQETLEMLAKAVKKAQRQSVRLPRSFVRDPVNNPAVPPLAGIIRGGGALRLKTYMTVLMMATQAPHETKVASSHIAELLFLDDPATAGARKVSKAFRDLEGRALVERTREAGHTPKTLVLRPDGSGSRDWSDQKLGDHYVSLPAALWTRGWIVALSGRALAMLLIMKEVTGGRKGAAYVPGIRKRQYALSDDFWTGATKELVAAGLLGVTQGNKQAQGETRRRNLYMLHEERLRNYDAGAIPGNIDESLGI